MTNTLTITIGNIPEKYLAKIWEYGIKEAKRDLGVPIDRTNSISIDFAVIAENYPDNRELLSEIVGGAISGYVVMTADKILNSH